MAIKPRIYLETTIFNYYFLEDLERREDIAATKKLLGEVKQKKFDAYISGLTIDELEKCPDISKKTRMFKLIDELGLTRLTFESSILYEALAKKYILAGAIPETKRGDALHLAIATAAEMDILTSWNCDHIVRFKTQEIVRTINLTSGYADLSINTPREVVTL